VGVVLDLFTFAWPPLSAFEHSQSPRRARLWWVAKIVACTVALIVLVVAMHDASRHLPANSGRYR
jgi:hypothetical protein